MQGKGGSESNGVLEKDKRWGASERGIWHMAGLALKIQVRFVKHMAARTRLHFAVEVPELRRSATRHRGFMVAFSLGTKRICKG